MTINILDYSDRAKEVDVGELDDIRVMIVTVATGDEILTVGYKDGTTKQFDSSDDRMRYFYDGNYVLYDNENGINVIEDPEWLHRTHYSYLREHGDCSEADMSD